MKKAMTITYTVDGSLYVNITNKCSNRCTFCIRNNGDGAYGSDSLWLEREPLEDEIVDSILSHNLSEYRELVFCGYGEPSYRLDVAVSVVRRVKEKYPDISVRINTNGQSDIINGRDTASEYSVFDTVSISLNTPSKERYCEICIPVFGPRAFDAMLDFAIEVKKYTKSVLLSVVRETLTEEELSECEKIANRCGVSLKVRTYISG